MESNLDQPVQKKEDQILELKAKWLGICVASMACDRCAKLPAVN